ncbi:MAG TPA: HAD-IIB family hydrolase [Ramlibacter sp.]|nr:HAD-IIB family hydrolase [Ramlibacter sp.]
MPAVMCPLVDWPAEARRQIFGVFTDIDDTLTSEGAVPQATAQALADLKAAGLHVIPITGRPVGWSVPFAQAWPVDAIVAENGAVALVRARSPHPCPLPEGEGEIQKLYQQDAATRAANFARMQQVAQRILREVPGATLAQDSPGRETDIAIDHSEFNHLPQHAIDRVVRIMQSEGMSATVSSIHINGWYGAHNKLEGARWIVRQLYGRDLEAELNRWVYVGDSTNDQLMFQHFAHSIGVANIRRFEAQLEHKPRWVTPSERGEGFCEVARALLAARD